MLASHVRSLCQHATLRSVCQAITGIFKYISFNLTHLLHVYVMQANASQDVASLAALLLAVGRYNSLEAAYVASRMPLVAAVWDEAAAMLAGGSAAAAAGSGAGGLGGGWLLLLYNGFMGLLEGDAAWLAGCLPAQQQQLLLAVAVAAFEKVGRFAAFDYVQTWLALLPE
jgi:hypothetical protein